MPLSRDRALQAYVVGLAIGDGNLSNPNGRAVRLRITCDTKYPEIIKKVITALSELLPKNRVSIVRSRGNFVNVSVYSNHLESLLGWKALGGSKHKQGVSVPKWIFTRRQYVIPCLRGLIETDGAIYKDRGYQMVIFSTVIPMLARHTHTMMSSLGFNPHRYRVVPTPPRLPKYQVRLSKDADRFLRVVQPMKT